VKSLNNKFFLTFFLLSILLIGQTSNSTNLIQWFSAFLPVIVNLFIIFSIIMFIYAILKAPLEVLKKDLRYVSYIAFLGQTLDYLSSVVQTLMSLLYLFFIFLLPLILILILYRSFMALVRSK
jgi:hypothetical protein